jgi:hypothetical protein
MTPINIQPHQYNLMTKKHLPNIETLRWMNSQLQKKHPYHTKQVIP